MTKREQLVTDKNEIKRILNTCLYLNLGLIDDGKPYVVPMNYGVDYGADDHMILYLHSARDSRKLHLVENNPNCAFSMECNVKPFEGKLACQYGMAFESIMGHGKISIIKDNQERAHALLKIMETQTGKSDFQFDDRMVSIVGIMRIDVEEYTAKHRPLPATYSEQ